MVAISIQPSVKNGTPFLPTAKKTVAVAARPQVSIKLFGRRLDLYENTHLELLLAREMMVNLGLKSAVVVRAHLGNIGTPIGPYDTLIVGTAFSLHAILVTHNTGEFERVNGLELEDWY